MGCLFFTSSLASAKQRLSAAPDTVPGQGQLVKQLAAAACQRVGPALGGAAPATLSATQAQEAFEQVLSAAIENQVADIRQLARRTKAAGAYDQLRAELPTATALCMVRTCPAAAALYDRFSSTITGAPAPTRAEAAFVQSWGDELCRRLAALNEKGQFQGKTSAERFELFHQEYAAALAIRGPQIMQLYGAAGNSNQVTALLSSRMTDYMKQSCPQSLMLLKDTK